MNRRICGLALLGIAALLSPAASSAAEPTLARLAFWVPPERMGEFEIDYREQVLTLLKQRGLKESKHRGRVTPDSVFSRLFEFESPAGEGTIDVTSEPGQGTAFAVRLRGANLS